MGDGQAGRGWIRLEKGYFEDLVLIVYCILEVYTQAGVSSTGGWGGVLK